MPRSLYSIRGNPGRGPLSTRYAMNVYATPEPGDESIPERSGGLLHAQEKLCTTLVVTCMRPKGNPGCSEAEPGEDVIFCSETTREASG